MCKPRDFPDKDDFEKIAELQYRERRHSRLFEVAARKSGVSTLQLQLLIQVVGFRSRSWAYVGELAERLQILPHGAASLVSRCEALDLVRRRASRIDGRKIEVHLLPTGEDALAKAVLEYQALLRATPWEWLIDGDFQDTLSDRGMERPQFERLPARRPIGPEAACAVAAPGERAARVQKRSARYGAGSVNGASPVIISASRRPVTGPSVSP
ncbi:MarR family winged helix-turn-helix transcriptional regulator [Burkholderia cepacia]|uniref:MarR family winged helix-turn-helix transcriptional regulator n=1 Tax=Burkholderia cepacia TaxID=292 RepID=UPI00264C5196|nr:MarR family winged helix-turn-helix transcriptional regulator [Burkholderia cepacia]MDN7858550.1 MarR family winged helix-turn-helix transcriptional regulator [Burkholderia cepacia]